MYANMDYNALSVKCAPQTVDIGDYRWTLRVISCPTSSPGALTWMLGCVAPLSHVPTALNTDILSLM